MLEIKYQGLRIDITYSAMQELTHEGKTIHFILKILTDGYNAPRLREKGKIEKWLNKGNKTYNAVIAEDYDEEDKEKIWKLIHFGKFGIK